MRYTNGILQLTGKQACTPELFYKERRQIFNCTTADCCGKSIELRQQ